MTLKQVIKHLMAQARRSTLADGTVEFFFAGNVHWTVREAIWAAYRRGELDSNRECLVGTRDNCHVSFRFGSGISTQNYVKFCYTDERIPAANAFAHAG